jgi:uncharacterized protein YegJ (DUF2314 family)
MKIPEPLRRTVQLIAVVCGLVTLLPSCKAESSEAFPSGSPATGAIRYQFAVYYLSAPPEPAVAALESRLKSGAQAPRLVESLPDLPTAALVRARFDSKVQEDYAPPNLEMLQRFGRGLTREQAIALQKAQHALLLDFAHPQSLSLTAYRSSLAVTEHIARDTHGLIWDEETREVFTPDEWHRTRLEGWDGGMPDVQRHTVIHAYQGEQLVRAITLGMAKFGLPDVVVNDFSWSTNRSMGNLINLLAQAMVEGATVGSQGLYDLDVRTIAHSSARRSQLDTLKPNAAALAKLALVKGTPDEGDPHNRLMEIRFDRSPGPDRYARQEALLGSLFGTEDAIKRISHDEELLAASKAARAKLPKLQNAFIAGFEPGEYLMVKAPFKTPGGGHEWMWVEVTAWRGDEIRGLLKNEPFDIPALHAGQMVAVSQAEVFDYMRRGADGRQEGNETSKIIERMQGAKD